MNTRVVNMRTDHYDVYIGRPGRGMTGIFGNPYPVGKMCRRCGEFHENRESTLPCFRMYFEEKITNDRAFRLQVMRLRGKTLGCFCKPARCHGDVIVEWLERNSK